MSTSLADWKGVPAPTTTLLEGRFIRLERLDPARHADELFKALQGPDADPKLWDYLPYGPFPERSVFNDWLNNHAAASDPYFFSVIDRASGEVQGILSLMSTVVRNEIFDRIIREELLDFTVQLSGKHLVWR